MTLAAIIVGIDKKERDTTNALIRKSKEGVFASMPLGFYPEQLFMTSAKVKDSHDDKLSLALDEFLIRTDKEKIGLCAVPAEVDLSFSGNSVYVEIWSKENEKRNHLYTTAYSMDRTIFEELKNITKDKEGFYVGYRYMSNGQSDRNLVFIFNNNCAVSFLDTAEIEKLKGKITLTQILGYFNVKEIIPAPTSLATETEKPGVVEKRHYKKREAITETKEKTGKEAEYKVIPLSEGHKYVEFAQKQIYSAHSVMKAFIAIDFKGDLFTTVDELQRWANRPKQGEEYTFEKLASKLKMPKKEVEEKIEEMGLKVKDGKIGSRSAAEVYDAFFPKPAVKELTAIIKAAEKEIKGPAQSDKAHLDEKKIAYVFDIDKHSVYSLLGKIRKTGIDTTEITNDALKKYIDSLKKGYNAKRKDEYLARLEELVSGKKTRTADVGVVKKIPAIEDNRLLTEKEIGIYGCFDEGKIEQLKKEGEIVPVKGDGEGMYLFGNVKNLASSVISEASVRSAIKNDGEVDRALKEGQLVKVKGGIARPSYFAYMLAKEGEGK
ncbi:MAG: hypothetical protein Q7J54_05710 [Candidatus Woesearchaeota archaeon]|nr:hypothetical protein [Candidatus Woesearchaeota archaeon]